MGQPINKKSNKGKVIISKKGKVLWAVKNTIQLVHLHFKCPNHKWNGGIPVFIKRLINTPKDIQNKAYLYTKTIPHKLCQTKKLNIKCGPTTHKTKIQLLTSIITQP